MSSSSGKQVFGGETRESALLTAHAVNDEFGGVILEMPQQPMDAAVFGSLLRASLSQWRLQGKKGVWIKLPIELVNLVEVAVKEGFRYHHAEPTYLMLVYWIPLPANATHQLGIDAFIMNDKREVLVVQEKYGLFWRTRVWKFPTGAVDEGEDIYAAAVREVKEETGIDSEFVEVLAFRLSDKSFFEKSDLFFVCMLRPLSFDIRKQESEIKAAQWMPFEEYAAQPFFQKHELMKSINNLCLAKIDKGYSGFSPVPVTSSFSDKKRYLYLNNMEGKSAIQEQGWGVEIQDRHDAVKKIAKSLLELQQVLLDMAMTVEAQGEQMDHIEHHVMNAAHYVKDGTKDLKTAKVYQRNSRKWMRVELILLLVLIPVVVIPIAASLNDIECPVIFVFEQDGGGGLNRE